MANLRRAISLAVAVSVAGCATQPANVAPAYVSTIRYEGIDCNRLLRERDDLATKALEVTRSLQGKANADAVMLTVGMLVFLPLMLGLAATGGKPEEQELARLRGELEAVERVGQDKNCAFPVFSERAPDPAISTVPKAE